MKKYRFLLLSVSSILMISCFSQENNDTNIVKIEKYIKKKIKDPVITKQECPIPGMSYFTAFAKEYAAEDPLIEDDFFIDKEGRITEDFDITTIDYFPDTQEKRINVAVWLLQMDYYATIKSYDYKKTDKEKFEVKILTDLYPQHPFYHEPPIENIEFVIVCDKGKWKINFLENLYNR